MTQIKEEPAVAIKLSANEEIKANSDYLHGTLAADLADANPDISKDSVQLIKFHGSYQQDDRDTRKRREQTGLRKYYMFMVRCRIPGGKVTADQYLTLDDLAGTHANGTLRFTTRQSVQLHGIVKKDLKGTIAAINESLLTTLGACGDVSRNIMCCPTPLRHDGLRDQLQTEADRLAVHLAPRTTAYHEIWLNGQQLKNGELPTERPAKRSHGCDAVEPIYGNTYLPRKFKTGLTLPEDNCIDVYSQDLGFVADVKHGQIVGYNVLVGGGMGMTHGRHDTFPHLAQPICWIPAANLLTMAEAVVKLYRDHGNRADRKRARIKYLVAAWGTAKFCSVLEEYTAGPLASPKPILIQAGSLHHGWNSQGDGRFFYGLSIENGRVKDHGGFRLRTALRLLVEQMRPALRLTPSQDVLLCDLPATKKQVIEDTLRSHEVRLPHELSDIRRHSIACPAIPTCGLALTESERALPGVINQLEKELQRLGLERETLTVRMAGCPNGCARPFQSDIGLVGRSGDKYTIFVGGRPAGDRLNFLLRDLVPLHQIVPTLIPLLEAFGRFRQSGEGFGDYCTRLGIESLQGQLPQT
jgi:sulfite reductase (ferredoxin)